jgi:hypothetical protein
MGIENLNRAHWALLGIFLGATLAYAWVGTSGNVDGITATSQFIFENELTQKEGDLPLISSIVIHPPQYSPADRCQVNQVTYKRLARDKKTGKMDYWLDRWFVAKLPYRPVRLRPQTSSDPGSYTIEAYLADVAKMPNCGFVQARFGWWMIPKNAVMVGGAVGLVVIGGVWPTLLAVMTGAGLGPKKKPKNESLWNYKSRTPQKQQAQNPTLTAADRERLEQMTDAYEKELAKAGMNMGPSAPTELTESKTRAPQELRKLEQGTLKETAQTTGTGNDDTELKYKEYYPVVVKKSHEEKDHKNPG